MRNVLFSTKDSIGDSSNLVRNFYNHARRKTHHGSWGGDTHTLKLFPRGKAYDRMFELHLDSWMNKYDYF